MIIVKTYDMDEPPNVPMITGTVQKKPTSERISDAFISIATAIAKAFSPSQASVVSTETETQKVPFSPGKKS